MRAIRSRLVALLGAALLTTPALAADPIVVDFDSARWETKVENVIVDKNLAIVLFNLTAKQGERSGFVVALIRVSECSKLRGTILLGNSPISASGYREYAFDKEGKGFADGAGVGACMAIVKKEFPDT
ncbi:hypothetical protein GCM10007860_31830 [Chitiniphilus shinanonensis]|uniref:Lipoprotein n=1 Tax=Chitiniphilus shinanonensis TaxID=553088 RepID=A0ABQ6C1G1_9NEIS|nr:hypothetical protein [Chitiniphilus shinanonensis]GLS06018.1 hypothetical protein GCM10007860_31830 [Chitiniphilus shinanonensis]